MSGVSIGKQLEDAGWEQGVLLPPLACSVIYLPENPVTSIAKAAAKAAAKSGGDVPLAAAGLAPHHVASGGLRASDRLVVVSQTCDIIREPNIEPTVMTMRAFFTDNERILGPAASNSTRNFLLDPDRGLVVDATMVSMVEKPFLATLAPEAGVPDAEARRRFALWLAHRFNRPALPDRVIEAIVTPILENLRSLQEAGDEGLRALDPVREVRIAHPGDQLPYDVRLLFIVPEEGLPDGGAGLAQLVGRMHEWFDPAAARLVAAQPITYHRISVGDYYGTDRIYLDYYTYRGRTIQGLGPLPPI